MPLKEINQGTGSTGPKRTPVQREIDLTEIAEWRCHKKTLAWIAKWIGENRPYRLSLRTIQNDWDEVTRRWRERMMIPVEAKMQEHIANCEMVQARAMESYLKSLADAEAKNVTESSDVLRDRDGKPVLDGETGLPVMDVKRTVNVSKQGQTGGAHYLQVYLNAGAEIMKVIGGYAASKTEVSGPNGGIVAISLTGPELESAKQIMFEEMEQQKIAEINRPSVDTPENPK